MLEFEKPRIDVMDISEDGTYGKFVVEPLERGYGTTLGNSLRRIMLSSLPGAAISSIIQGCPMQDTLPLRGSTVAIISCTTANAA